MLSRASAAALVALVAAISVANAARLGREVIGQRSVAPAPWKLARAARDEELGRFTLALRQRNLDVLDKVFWEVSDPKAEQYGEFMSVEAINALVRDEEAVGAARQWLQQHGVRDEQVVDGGDALRVRDVPVSVMKQLFGTEFHLYIHPRTGQRLVRNLGEWSLPSSLHGLVEMVTGVSDFPPPRPNVVRKGAATDPDVIPYTIRQQYSIPDGTAVSKNDTSAAVIEYQNLGAYRQSDLEFFFSATNTPVTTVSHTVGAFSTPAATESTLDIQYLLGLGVGSDAWYWTSADWLYDFTNAFFTAAEVPSVISQSYGWYESDQCSIDSNVCSNLGFSSAQYVARVNTEFKKIGLRGVSVLASSGDSGANGRTDPFCTDSTLRPAFPAASPFVTAVGATQLQNAKLAPSSVATVCSTESCAASGEEVAVSYAVARFASGGGFSQLSAQPSYQTAAVNAYLNSGTALPPAGYYNATNRGFPDIAALGHNFLVRLNDAWSPVGGTSASCPTIAGIIALVNSARVQAGKKPLGFLNPVLYQMYADEPSAFNDITVGDNRCTEDGCASSCKGFNAAKGWDPVTGLGSPNFAVMKTYLVEKVK